MGPYLSTPKTEKNTTVGQNGRFRYAASEMQGWRVSMQDAKITHLDFDTDASLFGVFDGHGGKQVAEFVTRHFVAQLLSQPLYQQGQYGKALQKTFLRMDELLCTKEGRRQLAQITGESLHNEDSTVMAGCTAVVALVKGTTLYVANAGDSRCVLGRRGTAIPMSFDHKPENQEELSRIQAAGGYVDDGRVMGNLNLSRSLGDLEYKKNTQIPPEAQMITAFPDIKVEELTPQDDFLVLACDGVWDMLTNQQCVEFITQRIANNRLDSIVQDILNRCLAPDIASSGGLGCDNMTAIVVAINHSQLSA